MKKRKRGLLPDTFGAYVLNNAPVEEKYNLPIIGYFGDDFPDYFALYSNLAEYNKTNNTCVVFYEYDEIIDSINGLWNSIIYARKKQLDEFKKRFKGIKYIVCPDYSITGDMPICMQVFNIYRSRVVAIWLRNNCNCIIIPNLRFNNSKSYNFCFEGISYRSIVSLSIYGLCSKKVDVNNLINGLHEAIIRIRPRAIIIYGECTSYKFEMIFKECINEKIQLIRPESRKKAFWRSKYGIAK